jgi:NodT family efflux transporter outer membrane factor (OMF) lipoprotein
MFTAQFSISILGPMETTIRTATGAYPPSAILLLLVLALAGCASNPDVPTPGITPSPTYLHGQTQPPGDSSGDLQWWRQFGDEGLVRLVECSAVANHDIRIAVERAREARAGRVVADSRLFPSVDMTATLSNSSTGQPSPVKQSMPDTRTKRAGLEVGWEVDLFGGARAAAGAASRDAKAAAFGVSAAQLIATSEVARQYFIWHGARQRLKILESLLRAQRDTERLTRSRYREGMVSGLDVASAAAETSSMQASLLQLRTLMAVTESRIAVLTGSDPSIPVPELEDADEFQWIYLKQPVSGQPADLLRRRPDLLAAEQRLAAESSRLAEAKANRFPKIFLSALFGRQELTLNDSLDLSAARYSNVALAFALPLFNAGRVQAGIDAQSARERESLLSYEKAILGAIEDVENRLSTLASERQRLDVLSAAVSDREQAVFHAKSLFREGQIDLLQLLDVQRARLATELLLAESNAQYAVAYVQLYKALGGGWQVLPAPANAQITANSSSGDEQ